MKVFITGATGFVGRHIVRELLNRGYEVHAGVRNLSKLERLFGNQVKGYIVNFDEKDSIREALGKVNPDFVIHLIGILYEEKKKGITFERVHYGHTKNLVEVSKGFNVKKFLFMSALGTHDEAPSRYHQTKRWAEREVINSGLNYTIFRPSIILGPEQKLFFDMYKITKYIPVVALPDFGNYQFQPVDVRDVACAYAEALKNPETDRKIYELCGTKVVTFKELLADIFSYWDRKVLMIPMPKKLMYFAGLIVEKIIEPPPFSSDQIKMMWKPNVCGVLKDEAISNGIKSICKREPIPYEESLKWSLENFDIIIKGK
ncbi:complex I NDUFA9 subunit family protein [Aquifex aeolicus]|uniref:NADH dehydrogenase (Ubiquinone) n=1 Tax=Aquifex aeolicus (strain VF5) TaxID=224324 RepID=O66532_AQUAE|nr:complex I NDUFA9 subunit family protein [Aquifex aeolicus]AAC06490.1 NADH dehydrogenase (ubiquinone) [Aquifex aeolicus VF5]